MESKHDLRKHFREVLKDWRKSREDQFEFAQRMFSQNLIEFLKNKSGLWCAYQALPDEPGLTEVLKMSAHIGWVFPVVNSQDLIFRQPLNFMSFEKGAFGILEPTPENSRVISLEQINGFLVPGQAFDEEGGRLGRGKSFYDRALKNYTGPKVGLCYSPQVSKSKLPLDVWDVKMDYLVTEDSVLRTRSK